MLAAMLGGSFDALVSDAVGASQQSRPSRVPRPSVIITPRAVVIDEQHYQASFPLSCAFGGPPPSVCRVDVPVPDGFDRLMVRRVSCLLEGDSNSQFRRATFDVLSDQGEVLTTIFMAPNLESAETQNFVFNSWTWTLYVTAPDSGRIVLRLAGGVVDGSCTVLGLLRELSTTARSGEGVRERLDYPPGGDE
jgi:hypothetical protein